VILTPVPALFRGRGGPRRAVPPPTGADPYEWFSSFNKNLFPPHAGAGAWGIQRQIQVAAAPTTTSTGTAGTATQLQDACYTPGTQVTLTDIIPGVSISGANVTDVDVIIPTGTGIISTSLATRPVVGRGVSPYRTIRRLRFRGSTLGTFSGGQIHNLQVNGDVADLIFDGVAMSGPEGSNASSALHVTIDDAGGRPTRIAIHNVRANCGGGFMLNLGEHVTVVNCSILTAQGVTDPADAWGFRMSSNSRGNLIFYGNDIRASEARGGGANNVFHRIRCHPDPGLYYVWAYNNTIVDRVEARIFMVDAAFAGGTGTADGAWFEENLVIAADPYGASGRECSIKDALYGRIINNTFQSDQFTSTANLTLGTPVVDGDKTTGNVFESLPGSDPAWGAAGDPSAIDWQQY
jgi:hypothetical protein